MHFRMNAEAKANNKAKAEAKAKTFLTLITQRFCLDSPFTPKSPEGTFLRAYITFQ